MSEDVKNIDIVSNMSLNTMLGENNRIVIPIIQRDYAQGRDNAKELRIDFVKDIFNHLDSNQPIKLSFVYGTMKGNVFVPYDGQQRLTLIYLLTLYLAAYSEEWDCIKKLSRFDYFTRDHATAFCHFLTEFNEDFSDGKNNVFQRIDIHDKKNIAESIINDSLFFGSWSYEPTVSSMIVVLQTIQDEFLNITDKLNSDERKLKAKSFLTNIEGGSIFFDWCSIHASDNIYIKMNGRGKPLSAFDNFKNTLYSELDKLRKYAEKEGKQDKIKFLSEFEVKMDGIWTDLFWEYRDIFTGVENYDIAPYMMNFLYYIFEFRHAARESNFFFGGKESFKWIDEKNVVTFLVKFKELCDVNNSTKKGKITIDDYIWLSKLLDIISQRLLSDNIDKSFSIENYSDEIQLFKELSSHKENSGTLASSRTVIVASLYFEYLVNTSKFDSNGNLISTDDTNRDQWIEFINRLIKTASYFKARYDALLRDKHILSGFVNEFIPIVFNSSSNGNFLVFAKEFDNEKLKGLKSYFDASHVYSRLVEEIEKYKLRIINQELWTNTINEVENKLPLFDGMIYFLILLSHNSEGIADIDLFKKYADLMSKILKGKEIINQNKFTAIMLSYADYRIGYGNCLSLCSNTSDATFSWRYFFDVLDGGIIEKDKTKIEVIKYALDLIYKFNGIDEAYESLSKDVNDSSWRSIIIRYPEVLNLGSKHRIIFESWDDDNCYLIKSDGVRQQVHSNSLFDSINLELYGLYQATDKKDKLGFEPNKIIIDNERFIVKNFNYIIHEQENEKEVDYSEALQYLNKL